MSHEFPFDLIWRQIHKSPYYTQHLVFKQFFIFLKTTAAQLQHTCYTISKTKPYQHFSFKCLESYTLKTILWRNNSRLEQIIIIWAIDDLQHAFTFYHIPEFRKAHTRRSKWRTFRKIICRTVTCWESQLTWPKGKEWQWGGGKHWKQETEEYNQIFQTQPKQQVSPTISPSFGSSVSTVLNLQLHWTMALIQQRFKDHDQLSTHSVLLVLTLFTLVPKANKKWKQSAAHKSMPLLNQIVPKWT